MGKNNDVKLESSRVGRIGILAILSLTLMGMGTNEVTPAMATLAEHFVGRNVSFIQTVATLSMVLGSLLSGAVMGKKMKIKTLAIVGSTMCFVFGILPTWVDNFALILVIRFVFGFGFGLLTPLGNSLIMMHFKGERQSFFLGMGTLTMNIGGVVFQMLSGILADISWRFSFLGHAFFIVAVIMAFFLPREVLPPKKKEKKESSAEKEVLNWKSTITAGILILIFQALTLSVMMIASTLYEVRGAGGSTVAALALTVFSVTGMAAGLLFGIVYKRCRRWMFTFAFGSVALGVMIVFLGQTAIVMGIGYGIVGLGYNWQLTTFISWIGLATPKSTVGTGTSILLAMMNMGGFLSSFWMITLRNNLTWILLTDVILCAFLTVFLFLWNPLARAEAKNGRSEGEPSGQLAP